MKLALPSITRTLIAIAAAWASLAVASPCPQPLRVGLADRGFAAHRSASGYAGISVEIVRMAAQRAGRRVDFVWLPSSRLMVELSSGRIDIAATMLHDPHRDAQAVFLPYAYTLNYLVSPKRDRPAYASFEQFMQDPQARLNIVRGLLPSPTVRSNLPALARQGRVEEVNDFATLFRKMAAGRVEAAVMSPWVYLWYSRAAGMEAQVDVLPLPEAPRLQLGMYMANARSRCDTVDAIAASLRQMLADGSVEAIFEHQMGTRLTRQLFSGGPGPLLADLAIVHSDTTP